METDKFTVVFYGDLKKFDANPLAIVSPFGKVFACGFGDEFAASTEHANTIEALRAEYDTLHGYAEMNGKMVAEIEALRAENARLKDNLESLCIDFNALAMLNKDEHEENAKLRAALKPFADVANEAYRFEDNDEIYVKVGDLRAAREAARHPHMDNTCKVRAQYVNEAADTIEALRAENARLQSRIDDLVSINAKLDARTATLNALRAENARLREENQAWIDGVKESITLRAARAAMGETE